VPGAAERFPPAESVIVKTMKPVRYHHLAPAAAGQAEHGILPGEGQCGGKCRLPLPEEHAHVGSVFPGPLGFH
jgi:hypothetical protein